MDDLVEQGRHLAEMLHREDRVEHFALLSVLLPYIDGLTAYVSVVRNNRDGHLTERAQ